MRARSLYLLVSALCLTGCNANGTDDDDDAGGGSSAVDGVANTPIGAIDLVGGIAFADTDNSGELTVGLTSWRDPTCTPADWMWDALDQNEQYAFVLGYLWSGEPDLSLTWGDGQSSGSGGLFGDGTMTLDPETADGLAEGDAVTGALSIDDSETGLVEASFEVAYCGERAQW